MAESAGAERALTKNQTLVLNALEAADGPLSAYGILDLLREHGFRAPLQVYRALERLTEIGLVHRLESLNAFVACCHKGCSSHAEAIVFTICEDCGSVAEISDSSLAEQLAHVAGRDGFRLKKSTVELRGLCAACQQPAA
ncbi:Fur family transcriptional regulator [Coralliovum pocilloporae]|uniref:Fur family transcriptional regulator n=1 Tax=Coralliovum pocilloporae TaxID=3066369 RepID=UPI003307ABE5